MKRKAAVDTDLCVSCGACAKVCPKGAIKVYKGIYAKVDMALLHCFFLNRAPGAYIARWAL